MLFSKKKVEETAFPLLGADSPVELKEAYNTLCTNVIYLPIEDKCKKLAITSASYGEGKASVAINLATSLAASLLNKKILLIDADMRSYYATKCLNAVDKLGISDYFLGNADKTSVVNSLSSNLDVVYAGNAPMNPAALICSDKMSEFLAECESNYDYIVIDTPPVNVVSDAVLLLNKVNGYVLATREKYSTVTMLDRTQETLTAIGASVLGLVLTDSKNK